jgi:hypothetical protein
VQLKQNLIFLFRAATVDSPFHHIENGYYDESQGIIYFPNPATYEYAGFYQLGVTNSYNPYEFTGAFDPFWPFENNYRYLNFAYNTLNVNAGGQLVTGVGLDYSPPPDYQAGLVVQFPPTNQFQPPVTSGTTIPAVLAANQWLVAYPMDLYWDWNQDPSDPSARTVFPSNGFTGQWPGWDSDEDPIWTLADGVKNYWGLPYVSALLAGGDSGTITTTLSPGNSYQINDPNVYMGAAQPQFQTVEYDFWNPSLDALPGSGNFSPTNQSGLLFTPVGTFINCWPGGYYYPQPEIQIAGYAKLAVTNGYPGVYGYLGQYFDQAYQKDANGNVTTNKTGIVSPYGNFFATEPGPAALVTMPDVDTGERGVCTVNCISMQVDKNDDGTMDLSWNGPDTTSQTSPYRIWVNNGRTIPGTGGNLDQDLPVPPNHPELANYSTNEITCPRDLENFFRLWICGVPQLPVGQGYAVTMSMSPVSGNPAVNLYYSCETNGGIGYLTNANIAATQTGSAYYANALCTISNGRSCALQMDSYGNLLYTHFLFEGAGIGSGELVLTISQNGNVVTQTGVWLDLHDIKDFYEQAVITNKMSGAISNWSSTIESVQPAISSAFGNDTNLIVFVHGINVGPWDWLDDSDTVFKRLYWAGYHGKFATVKWPCNPINFFTFLTLDTDDFNDSEAKAYKASLALTNYLPQLRARFPGYRLNLLVHSQGNAVVSEAILRGGVTFDTYILTQGAMPDSAYDVDASINTDIASHDYGTHITPEWQPMGYHGIYTNFTGRIVNFYNPLDKVLGYWVDDQTYLKPTYYPTTSYYFYDGVNSYYDPVIGFNRLVTDPEESRAMVSRSRTDPIGRSGPASAHGVIQSAVDLNAQFGFNGSTIAEHSAQWTRPIQTSLPYYQQFLLQIQPAP